VLPRAADALERRRRTSLVQQWIVSAAIVILALGGSLYVADVLPSHSPTNAHWGSLLGNPADPAQMGNMNVAVEVEGFAPDIQAYDRRRFMQRIDSVRIAVVGGSQDSASVPDVRQALREGIAMLHLTRQESWFLISTRAGAGTSAMQWSVRATGVDTGTESVLDSLLASIYSGLGPQQRKTVYAIIADVIDPQANAEGKAIARATGGGFSHFVMPEFIIGRESLKQQAIAGAGTMALVGVLSVGLWIRVRVIDSKRKPWGNAAHAG
jgi:hypothetical protein